MVSIEQILSEITGYFMLPVLVILLLMFCYSVFSFGVFIYDVISQALFSRYPNRIYKMTVDNPQVSIETLELRLLKELEGLRIVSRVAPMLGLVATMIPIGPALVVVAAGDSVGMAEQLVIAFAAVIIALLSASLTYVVLLVRRRWLLSEISEWDSARNTSADEAELAQGEVAA